MEFPSCDLEMTRPSPSVERDGFCAWRGMDSVRRDGWILCVESTCLRTHLARLLARTETLMDVGKWTDRFGKGKTISALPTELRADAAPFRCWP